MNKKVFVIGSMSCMNSIKKAADAYKEKGYDVLHVRSQRNETMDKLIKEAFRHIDESDIVVAVTKEDGEFGTGTIYELMFAKYLNKEIHYYK